MEEDLCTVTSRVVDQSVCCRSLSTVVYGSTVVPVCLRTKSLKTCVTCRGIVCGVISSKIFAAHGFCKEME